LSAVVIVGSLVFLIFRWLCASLSRSFNSEVTCLPFEQSNEVF